MATFNFRPKTFRLVGAILCFPAGIGLIVFLNLLADALKYPLWLELNLYALAILFFYEGLAMLLKPISLFCDGCKFEAGYLVSQRQFKLHDIESYSAINYPTRDGLRKGVILHLYGNKVMELNEIIIDGDISILIEILEQQKIPRHREGSRTLWLSRLPIFQRR